MTVRLTTAAIALTLFAGAARAAVPRQSEAYDSFYNLDYDKALALFEKEARERPQSAEAWNQVAQTVLHRRLYLAGALESDPLGRSNSFLRRPRVEMPAEEQRKLHEALDRSMSISKARLGENSRDPEALYALGVAHVHLGNFRFLCEKAWYAALREANYSRNLHNLLRKVDASNPDALLIPGMHEYISGSLPLIVRVVASMTGIRGDRAKGISLLEQAVKTGRRTAVEARVMLALVYSREQQYDKAAALMRELSQAFPRNYLYRSEAVLLTASAGRREEARAGLAEIEKMKAGKAPELALMSEEKLARLRESVERRLRESD